MHLRDATPDDAPALVAVCTAAGGDLGPSPARYLAHVAARGRLVVAVHDGHPVAFAGVVDLAPTAFVTDLFVAPDRQGHGIATALMDELLRDRPVRTTFSSSHPAAIRAHARMGMRQRWRLRYLEGAVPAHVTSDRAPEVDVDTVDALPRPDIWRHLREVGASLVVLPGGGVAAIADGSAGSMARVLRLTTTGSTGDPTDHGADHEGDDAEHDRRGAAALHGLWRHLGPGRRLLVHVRDDTAIARILDGAGFVEVDADTCCSTLVEPFRAGVHCFHPGLA